MQNSVLSVFLHLGKFMHAGLRQGTKQFHKNNNNVYLIYRNAYDGF